MVCFRGWKAQSRCSFPSLIRYGSLRLVRYGSLRSAFLASTGMIATEDILWLGMECFKRLAREQEETSISVRPLLERVLYGNRRGRKP